jgi:hypothetical protein
MTPPVIKRQSNVLTIASCNNWRNKKMDTAANPGKLNLEALETRLEMEAFHVLGDMSNATPLAIEITSEPCTIYECSF